MRDTAHERARVRIHVAHVRDAAPRAAPRTHADARRGRPIEDPTTIVYAITTATSSPTLVEQTQYTQHTLTSNGGIF